VYANGPSRQAYKRKDPAGWQEFHDRLAEHSPTGQSLTIQGVQLARPTLYALEKDLDRLHVPTLVVVGDEDEACLEPGLFLKRHIRSSGLAVVPQTGHAINLEEPAMLNALLAEFFAMVEAGRWASRAALSTSLLPNDTIAG
jgi:pimeloyl-ACP methyl ester carboxylesterase